MNFYERAAKLLEVRSPYSSRPHKPGSGDRGSRSTERGPMTDAEREAEKAAGDAATDTVLAKSAEIAAKKKGDGDGDDGDSLNASKKPKKKVNAMKETFYLKVGKGIQEKMKNRPDDDDKLPDGPKAAPQATASNNAAEADLDDEDTLPEANTKGPDTDPSKESDRAKKLAQQGEKDQKASDSGWKDTKTGEPTTSPLNASKKRKSKQAEGKDWIQKAVNPDHKGYCTPMTKSTCTPARKALAKRFKKAGRKEKKSGGTGWQGKV